MQTYLGGVPVQTLNRVNPVSPLRIVKEVAKFKGKGYRKYLLSWGSHFLLLFGLCISRHVLSISKYVLSIYKHFLSMSKYF